MKQEYRKKTYPENLLDWARLSCRDGSSITVSTVSESSNSSYYFIVTSTSRYRQIWPSAGSNNIQNCHYEGFVKINDLQTLRRYC